MNRLEIAQAALLLICSVLIMPSCQEAYHRTDDLERFADTELTADQAETHAVILVEEDRWEITGRNEAYRRYRIVKKILKPGHPEEGTFAFPEDSYRKMISMGARALFPDGSLKIIDQDEIQRFPAFADYVLYGDQYSHLLRIQGIRAGTIIEFSAEQRFDNLVFLPPVFFQDDLPVVKRIFALTHPETMQLTITSRNMSVEPLVTRIPQTNSIEHVWEANDIPPIEHEDHAPPIEPYLPSVHVIVADIQDLGGKIDLSSWDGVVRWYEVLSRKSMKGGARIERMVRDLNLDDCPERERIRRIYRYVQENIRYVAIHLGLGGYRPHDADKTLECRYGDCKDQAAVLVASLREADIEAYPVLVRTKDRGHINDAAPTPGYFNHVIALATIDGADIFLDPTCGSCSFCTLPFGDQGAHALIIRREETNPIFLPVEQGQENRYEVSTTISIEHDGAALVSDTIRAQGFFSERYRSAFAYRGGRTNKEVARDIFLSRYPFAKVEDVLLEEESMRRDTMKIILSYSIPELLVSQRTSFVSPLLRSIHIPRPERSDRKYPLVLGERMILSQRLLFRVPDGRRIKAVNDSLTIRNDFFEYSARREGTDTSLRFERQYRLNRGVVPEEDLGSILVDIDAIESYENGKVVVEARNSQ